MLWVRPEFYFLICTGELKMRIKLALSIALLGVTLQFAGGAVCFAQSNVIAPHYGDLVASSDASGKDILVAAIHPTNAGQGDVQTDEGVAYSEESAAAEPADPGPRESGKGQYSHIGIGVKVSTLGAGLEVASPLTRKLNVRGGFNMMRLNHTFTDSGIQYNGQLQFQSAEAHLDWFPIGGFHVSPGLLFYNGNQITANATVPGGQTFSVGGTSYESDPISPVTGTGKLNFVKTAPSLMVGIGNLIPRSGRHYSFLFEVGAVYEGSARAALNLAGNVCDTSGLNCRAISSDPTVQANVQAQQVKIQHDVNPYRFFPVVSLGVGFNF
jgi:hypothetical protein